MNKTLKTYYVEATIDWYNDNNSRIPYIEVDYEYLDKLDGFIDYQRENDYKCIRLCVDSESAINFKIENNVMTFDCSFDDVTITTCIIPTVAITKIYDPEFVSFGEGVIFNPRTDYMQYCRELDEHNRQLQKRSHLRLIK